MTVAPVDVREVPTMNPKLRDILVKLLCFILGAVLGVPVCDFFREQKGACNCPPFAYVQWGPGGCPVGVPRQPHDPAWEPQPDTLAAVARITFGRSGCTATILPYGTREDTWYGLTAAHCVSEVGQYGRVTLPGGQTYTATVVAIDRGIDLALFTIRTGHVLPSVRLAEQAPSKGTPIWHQGYGVHKPGNVERGVVVTQADEHRWSRYHIRPSSGDSGAGLFQESDGSLIGVLSASGGGYTLGAGWEAVNAFLLKNIV